MFSLQRVKRTVSLNVFFDQSRHLFCYNKMNTINLGVISLPFKQLLIKRDFFCFYSSISQRVVQTSLEKQACGVRSVPELFRKQQPLGIFLGGLALHMRFGQKIVFPYLTRKQL